MTIYQISILSFFTSNGTDYAMAIDRNKDIMIFTDRLKAEEKLNELIDEHVNLWYDKNGNKGNEFICYGANMCTVIYHDKENTARTYITLDPKETL